MKPSSPKIFFGQNIKFLRERKKMSQETLAARLHITRAKLASLESGHTRSPQAEDYIHFSECFGISIDSLLKVELSKIGELKLRELEAGNDVYIKGGNLRVLAITVDKSNKENMEYVPVKARMGYKAGFNDPEYIASLPKFSLPNLPKHKTYRIFPSTGNSMLPIKAGTDFITEYVEDWERLRDTPCVLILKSEGADFVFKIATYQKEGKNFLLRSLNEAEYTAYHVPADEVLEVWKYYKHITDQLPDGTPSLQHLMDMIQELKDEVRQHHKN